MLIFIGEAMSLKEILAVKKQIKLLEKTLDKIKARSYKELWKEILETKLLGKIKWTVEYSKSHYMCLSANLNSGNELKDKAFKSLCAKISKIYNVDYNCQFPVDDKLGITINFDDGRGINLYNHSGTTHVTKIVCPPDKFIDFLLKNNVKVDADAVTKKITSTADELNNLNAFLKMYEKVIK